MTKAIDLKIKFTERRGVYRFACGARLPRANTTREAEDIARLCVVRYGLGDPPDQPIMPDGSDAPCLDCKHRRAGRRLDRSGKYFDDDDKLVHAILIMCWPEFEPEPS